MTVMGTGIEKVLQWADLVKEIAASYDLPPALVLAMIWIESRGNADSINKAGGATGLMQVMPYAESPKWRRERPTREALLDPRTNIEWGCKILKWFWKEGGSLWEGLRRYSGGSVWKSYGDYVRRYWQPVDEARQRIEQLLAEGE